MLQQEGGIEITLEMLTVLHVVPTSGKRLFNIFTSQMIILACFDICRVDLYNVRQPERLAFLPQYFDQHGGCLVGNGLSKPLFASVLSGLFRYHGLLCPVRQGRPFHFFHIEMITQGQQMVRQLNVLELSYFSLTVLQIFQFLLAPPISLGLIMC